MRKLTVPDFRNWILKTDIACFVFSSENNDRLRSIGLSIGERYSSLVFGTSPDRLCFRSGDGRLQLEHVKEVHLYDDCESIGIVFDILCGDEGGYVSWRFIAD